VHGDDFNGVAFRVDPAFAEGLVRCPLFGEIARETLASSDEDPPRERIYTFWKYFRNAFARDAGLRIDHLLLSPPIAGRLLAAGVDRAARGREHASDHAPAWIEIAETSSGPPRRGRRVVASASSS
jgi:exodeoxyribonuclease-3